jgi:YtcA family
VNRRENRGSARTGMERAAGIRRRARVGLGVSLLALAGCNVAPSQSMFGAYFPTWMLCALAGLVCAVAVHFILAFAGIEKFVPAPLIVDIAFAVFFGFAFWLLWLG